MPLSRRFFLGWFCISPLSAGFNTLVMAAPLRPLTPDEIKMMAYMKDHGVDTFVMLNKKRGQILFVENGHLVSTDSALSGKYRGDEHLAGLGTTPAGIHVLRSYHNGTDIGFKEIDGTNIDYAIHTLINPNGQRRPERLKSLNPEWKRISSGCVNVAQDTLNKVLNLMESPQTFKRNGGDYDIKASFFVVLPEEKPVESIFKYPEISIRR